MEARELRQIARDNLSGNWGLSVAVTFVAAFFGALICGSSSFNLNLPEQALQDMPETVIVILGIIGIIAGILALLSMICGGAVQLGYATYLLKQHDRANFEFGDLFSQFHRFGQGFAQRFLRGLYIFLWSLLFIIPGIVKTYAYAMTPFIMAENPEMTANEAITASREMMDGHKLELFWLDLTFIGWSIMTVFTLGIGTLFLNPYMNASYAAFYKKLTAEGRTYQ